MLPASPKKDFNLYNKSISFIWTHTSNDSCICLIFLLLAQLPSTHSGRWGLFEFNFIKIINVPSASTNPVTQLGSNPVKLLFLLTKCEYALVGKTELKDSPWFFHLVNIFFIFIITTIIINKNISLEIYRLK